jgi:hypothetical protein
MIFYYLYLVFRALLTVLGMILSLFWRFRYLTVR